MLLTAIADELTPNYYSLWFSIIYQWGLGMLRFVVVVQLLSFVWLFVTPWAAACQASLSFTVSLAQIHVYWVSDAIQPSHPLPLPSLALNVSQHQGLFQWIDSFLSGGQSFGASASVLPMNIQGWFPLGLTSLISLQSKGLSRVFSSTTIWKHQFFSSQLLYGSTLTSIHDYWKNHSFD